MAEGDAAGRQDQFVFHRQPGDAVFHVEMAQQRAYGAGLVQAGNVMHAGIEDEAALGPEFRERAGAEGAGPL